MKLYVFIKMSNMLVSHVGRHEYTFQNYFKIKNISRV